MQKADEWDGRIYLCRWSMQDKAYEVYICAAYQGWLVHLRAVTPLPYELFNGKDFTVAHEVLGFCDHSCNRQRSNGITLIPSAKLILKEWICRRKRVNTVREAKTIISFKTKQLKELENSDAFLRLWGYLNKAGARNLAHLPRHVPDIDAMVELSPEELNHWLQVFENVVFRTISFTPLYAKLPMTRRQRTSWYLWKSLLRPLSEFVVSNRLGKMDATEPTRLDPDDVGFGWIDNGEHLEAGLLVPDNQPACVSFNFAKFGRPSVQVYCSACKTEGFDDFQGTWKEIISFLFLYLHHVAVKLSANPGVIQTLIAFQEQLKAK